MEDQNTINTINNDLLLGPLVAKLSPKMLLNSASPYKRRSFSHCSCTALGLSVLKVMFLFPKWATPEVMECRTVVQHSTATI